MIPLAYPVLKCLVEICKDPQSAISSLPRDRTRWMLSLAQLSAIAHWNHYHKINNDSPAQVYYNKLEKLLGFGSLYNTLDKGVFKAKAWGLMFDDYSICALIYSHRGLSMKVPNDYGQDNLDVLLPLVLEALKIPDSFVKKYHKD